MKYLFIYITTKDKRQARKIGKALVAEKLAACANIIDKMESLYFWKGRLCDEREAVLVVKTRRPLLGALVKRVKRLHSYAVPCIVALPIAGGNPGFLSWVSENTEKRGPA